VCHLDQIEKVEIRAVIKYLCMKGMSPKKIQEDLMDTLCKEYPSYSTNSEFKKYRESIGDDEHPGWPKFGTI
jgi:hypothetical protein